MRTEEADFVNDLNFSLHAGHGRPLHDDVHGPGHGRAVDRATTGRTERCPSTTGSRQPWQLRTHDRAALSSFPPKWGSFRGSRNAGKPQVTESAAASGFSPYFWEK